MQGGYTNPLRKRLGGHVLYDADSSAQVSLKGALHLLAKLARPARSYPMGASAVPSGRWGIASSTRRWMSFSSKSATPPIGEGRGLLVGLLGLGQEGATRFRCSCHQPADLHRRSRAMLEGVRAHSLRVSKADSEPVALGRSGLRNWSECTITFVCAVSEVVRNMTTCICPQ